MMRTRRSLFIFGALLTVGVLLAPQAAFAQQPTNVVAAKVAGKAAATVYWNEADNADNTVVSYEVTCVTPTRNTAIPATTAALVSGIALSGNGVRREQAVTGLKFATSYTCGVRGRTSGAAADYTTGSVGDLTGSDLTTDAAPIPLKAPEGLDTTRGDGMVTVSWGKVDGATKYQVQYRTAAQGFSTSTRMMEVTAPAVSADVKPLVNGTEYMFRVRAGDADGWSTNYSIEVKQTPKAPAADIPLPQRVSLTPKETTQIEVKWAHGVLTPPTKDAEDQETDPLRDWVH